MAHRERENGGEGQTSSLHRKDRHAKSSYSQSPSMDINGHNMHASYQHAVPGHMVGEDVDVDDLQLVEVGGSTPLRVKNDDIYVRIRYRIFRSVPSLVVALLLIFVIAAFSKSTYGGEHSSNRITNNGQQKIELLEETVSLNSLLAMGGENDWTLYINRSAATTTVLNPCSSAARRAEYKTLA